MAKPKKWHKKFDKTKKRYWKKRKKRKKKFFIEIKTNRGWVKVELIKDFGRYLLVKLPCGELIKRKSFNHIRWGKTKLVTRKM